MDDNHFDDLLRSLSERPSRRGIGRTLAGFVLAGTLGRLSLTELEAKKKKRKKKKKCKGGKKKCGKKCRDLQLDPLNCGSCGNGCDVGRECVGGNCACPQGEEACGEACIPQVACCTDADCGNGEACVDGTCLCPAEKAVCDGICVDLATDGANCGACDNVCITGGCVNGACTCGSEIECPDACTCSSRLDGGGACRGPAISSQQCEADDDCPLGTFCVDSSSTCSQPCPG